jgi:phage-related protein
MNIHRKKAQVEVANHLIKWRTIQCPRRLHSPSCQWIFKSTYCLYPGGEAWCDHTWERCTALANTINFGGFPSISDMVSKEIWWGRKSSGSPV